MQQFGHMKMAGTFVHLQFKINLFSTVQPIAYMYQFSMHKVFLVNATFNIQAIVSLNTNENDSLGPYTRQILIWRLSVCRNGLIFEKRIDVLT